MQSFSWDPLKNGRNIEKHGIDFEAAKLIFGGPILEQEDARRDYGETRVVAIGAVEGTEIVVVYTWREESRRIISARRAHDKERKAYRAAFPQPDRSG
jgi:uncharacterized DUF497 family protein